MWEVPDYSHVTDFWTSFYVSFAEVFRFMLEYELHFPEPIGTITLFNLYGFFFVASLLTGLVSNIAFRGKKDDE